MPERSLVLHSRVKINYANKEATDAEIAAYCEEYDRLEAEYMAGKRSRAKDFCRLHATFIAEDIGHAGIIAGVQQRYSIGEQLRRLLNLIAAKPAE